PIYWIYGTAEFRERGPVRAQHWQRRLCRNFGGTMFTFLLVPQGSVSGAGLADSLGVTHGTYVRTWGTGLENQNFTLQIGSVGVPGVPDGGWTVSFLGLGLSG